MKHLTIATLIVTIAASAFAGPIQKAEIPATSTWAMHFDCEKAKDSEMGKLILNREKSEKEDQRLKGFIDKCGFDPIEDVKSVTVFGDSFGDKDGILIVKGDIATDKLDAMLETAKDHKTSTYGNLIIHTWQDKHHNRPAVGCFYDKTTILMGQKADKLKIAIDTLNKTAKGLDDESAKVVIPDVDDGVFFIICANKQNENLGQSPHAAMLRNAKSLIFALGESDGNIASELQITAKTEADAALMSQIVSGMLSYSLLSGDKAPVMADIAKSVQIEASGDTVNVALSYSSSKIFDAMQSWKESKAKWKGHRGHRSSHYKK